MAYFLDDELTNLAATVNQSQCWRALVETPNETFDNIITLADAGTADGPTALAAIKLGATPVDSLANPHCSVSHLEDGSVTAEAGGSALHGECLALVQFSYEFPTSYDNTFVAAQTAWRKLCSRILNEWITVADANGYIDKNRVELSYGTEHPDESGSGHVVGKLWVIVYFNREVY